MRGITFRKPKTECLCNPNTKCLTNTTYQCNITATKLEVKTMSERRAFFRKNTYQNYLSLRDVTLPFKPLTVLVGPNASGKSNTFFALHLLNRMIVSESLPIDKSILDSLWAGEDQKISLIYRRK